MRLFVDSSGWIALFDRDDRYHSQAAAAFAGLEGQSVHFITTDYVFDEALTFLRVRTGHTNAVRFGQWLLQARTVVWVTIEPAIWDAAWQMFQQYDDKAWAFTDCTSFVVMQRQQLYQAFTFDHHFAQAGFQLWPKAAN
jgi:uncharacterized protein